MKVLAIPEQARPKHTLILPVRILILKRLLLSFTLPLLLSTLSELRPSLVLRSRADRVIIDGWSGPGLAERLPVDLLALCTGDLELVVVPAAEELAVAGLHAFGVLGAEGVEVGEGGEDDGGCLDGGVGGLGADGEGEEGKEGDGVHGDGGNEWINESVGWLVVWLVEWKEWMRAGGWSRRVGFGSAFKDGMRQAN